MNEKQFTIIWVVALVIKELEKSIAKLTEKAAELATHIPNLDRAEYDVFAELLDDLRRKAGVNVPRANWTIPGRPAPIPGRTTPAMPATIHKVQYDLTVNGSFYQLLRYINLIEQQKRFIGVETFAVTKAGADNSPGGKALAPKRDLKVTIYSYTYKLPAQPFVIEAEEPRSGKSTDIPD
jgi:hypothetical protein